MVFVYLVNERGEIIDQHQHCTDICSERFSVIASHDKIFLIGGLSNGVVSQCIAIIEMRNLHSLEQWANQLGSPVEL